MSTKVDQAAQAAARDAVLAFDEDTLLATIPEHLHEYYRRAVPPDNVVESAIAGKSQGAAIVQMPEGMTDRHEYEAIKRHSTIHFQTPEEAIHSWRLLNAERRYTIDERRRQIEQARNEQARHLIPCPACGIPTGQSFIRNHPHPDIEFNGCGLCRRALANALRQRDEDKRLHVEQRRRAISDALALLDEHSNDAAERLSETTTQRT